ncbi:MAG: DNA polymerase III subunit epsilon [Pseudomonadales bacterium]|nr:DNA polymerase III subunit epsilon [Pseudomonadales bacterium]
MRQVVLDTETTGLEVESGHRVIEVGCVEIVDRKLTRRHFHYYINPERDIDDGAQEVHGISREFLMDKPLFRDIVDSFLEFVKGAELVIHNAGFDIAFLDAELKMANPKLGKMTDYCSVVDSLEVARSKHPGQRNNLDALCSRYGVDNTQRDLHGALLDAEILADVYLLMTGGQVALVLGESEDQSSSSGNETRRLSADRPRLRVIRATMDEIVRHEDKLDKIEKASGGNCVWRKRETDS